ncbi:MAG: hypothetical protein ABJA66_05525 [Actinomycetota bacterium]
MTSENIGLEKSGGLRAILLAGLTAGALDITAASVNLWIIAEKSPLWTFQSVAGGLLGSEKTHNGGYGTAALGLAIHFFIALTAAAIYYLASRKLKFMVSQAVLSGMLYGIFVWLFMNLIVLPLTPLKITYAFGSVVTGLIIHILCIGLPIALIIRRFSK